MGCEASRYDNARIPCPFTIPMSINIVESFNWLQNTDEPAPVLYALLLHSASIAGDRISASPLVKYSLNFVKSRTAAITSMRLAATGRPVCWTYVALMLTDELDRLVCNGNDLPQSLADVSTAANAMTNKLGESLSSVMINQGKSSEPPAFETLL